VVVAEESAQPFAARERAVGLTDAGYRFDEPVLQPLMIALSVIEAGNIRPVLLGSGEWRIPGTRGSDWTSKFTPRERMGPNA
jgi:hypothetical protein